MNTDTQPTNYAGRWIGHRAGERCPHPGDESAAAQVGAIMAQSSSTMRRGDMTRSTFTG